MFTTEFTHQLRGVPSFCEYCLSNCRFSTRCGAYGRPCDMSVRAAPRPAQHPLGKPQMQRPLRPVATIAFEAQQRNAPEDGVNAFNEFCKGVVFPCGEKGLHAQSVNSSFLRDRPSSISGVNGPPPLGSCVDAARKLRNMCGPQDPVKLIPVRRSCDRWKYI